MEKESKWTSRAKWKFQYRCTNSISCLAFVQPLGSCMLRTALAFDEKRSCQSENTLEAAALENQLNKILKKIVFATWSDLIEFFILIAFNSAFQLGNSYRSSLLTMPFSSYIVCIALPQSFLCSKENFARFHSFFMKLNQEKKVPADRFSQADVEIILRKLTGAVDCVA